MKREAVIELQVLDQNLFPEGWLSLSDTNSTALPPLAKKKKLSLTKIRTTQCSAAHFGHPVSEVRYAEAAKGIVPDNTKKCTTWGERAFLAWVEERNKAFPTDLLSCRDPTIISKYMRYFILEVRAKDGKKYPPSTIWCILSAIKRIYKESKAPLSIRDKINPAFQE